jgi:hypothetical protein
MNKYQRNYRLEVEGADRKTYIFSYPMTLEFNIQNNALASANTGSLRLYNLNPDTRKVIYKDAFDNIFGSLKFVRLFAGYGDSLSQIAYGNIKEAKSFREEGSVNFITEIDYYDWAFAMMNARSKDVLGPPEYELPLKRSVVISRLNKDMEKTGVKTGVINYAGFVAGGAPYSRPLRLDGNTWDLLRAETNDHCFIDNGILHALLDDDFFTGDVHEINASTGLLSTPKKSGSLLKVDILFEPALRIGQKIDLRCESETFYNDTYKIIGIQHSGIISGAKNGRCQTSLIMNAGKFTLINGEVTRTPVAL